MSRSGIAASIYSNRSCGIAAAALPPAFIAALPPAFTAALPPACIHIAALPPVCSCSVHSQRHCRQHACTAAVPPAYILRHCRQKAFTPLNLNSCCHFCSSASSWASILGVGQSLVTSVSDHACLAEQTSCQERSDRL